MLRFVVISVPFSEEIGGTKTPAALPFKIPDTKKPPQKKIFKAFLVGAGS